MRILVLNYEYPPLGGGAAPVSQQLCELFAQRGHTVTVVTMAFKDLPREETVNGVRILRVPAFRKRQETCETLEMFSYVASAFPRVTAMLRSGNFDIVHTHFIVPTGLLSYAASRFAAVPYVITPHGSDIPGYNSDRFTREHQFLTPLLRLIASGAARVVSPSLFLKNLAGQAIGLSDVGYIPNGIFPDRITPKPKRDVIFMAGRLLPRKGFQHVLEALEGIDTHFEVHIAGDGPLRSELEALAQKLTAKVVFHGWVDQNSPLLTELFETSAIFCMPSAKENASIALLEAMAAGMAVITSDVSGCPETVADTGIVVAPGDVGAIREALRRLTGSGEECAALGAKARARVEQHFDWNVIGDQYLALFKSIVERN